MPGSKTSLSRTGFAVNTNNTDRNNANPNEIRAENDSQLSKRTGGGVDLD